MRVVVQRVSEASVTISGEIYNSVDDGFLILLGIEREDSEDDIKWLVKKIASLRVMSDEDGKMNLITESDTHIVKYTWPVVPSGSSYTKVDAGTVYIGEGSWGVGTRSTV